MTTWSLCSGINALYYSFASFHTVFVLVLPWQQYSNLRICMTEKDFLPNYLVRSCAAHVRYYDLCEPFWSCNVAGTCQCFISLTALLRHVTAALIHRVTLYIFQFLFHYCNPRICWNEAGQDRSVELHDHFLPAIPTDKIRDIHCRSLVKKKPRKERKKWKKSTLEFSNYWRNES